MVIGNIGWSGNKNWGDERMAYCLKKQFKHDKIIIFNGWLDAIEHTEKLNACDYILIGGGGLIFRGFNAYIPFLKSIKKPFGCVGISIEADELNEDMNQGLDYLKSHADFIYVRDKKSRSLLQNHHKVILGPDISFLYPYSPSHKKGKQVGVNMRQWPWWDSELFGKADTYFGKIDKKFPWFQKVYPFKKWDDNQFVHIMKQQSKSIKPIPFYFGSYGTTDDKYLKTYFHKVPSTYSVDLLQQCKILVGMRLHSIIFATQMGIPFVSLSYEPKNANFCADLGLPELSLPLKEFKNIPKKIEYVNQHYIEISQQLIQYTSQAKIDAQHIFSRIDSHIHTS